MPVAKQNVALRGSVAAIVAILTIAGSGCQAILPSSDTYYIDSDAGSDAADGSSPEQAWKSTEKLDGIHLSSGDQVLLKRGTTLANAIEIDDSGNSSAPIRISTYGAGDLPVVTGGRSCVRIEGDHVEIDGLSAESCTWAGFEIDGSNVTLTNSRATGNAAGVVIGTKSDHARVTSNMILGNNVMSVNTPDISDDDSGAFGVLLNGTRTEVIGNVFWGHAADSYDYGTDGSAVEIFDSSGNIVLSNTAFDNDTFVEAGGAASRDNTIAYNAILSSLPDAHGIVTRGRGDTTFGPVKDTVLDNNTLLLTGAGSQAITCDGGCREDILTMRNNIAVADGAALWIDGPVIDEINIFWSDRRPAVQGGRDGIPPLGAGSKVVDPLLQVDDDDGLPVPVDASPARGAGRNLGYSTDVRGKPLPERSIDLGAVQTG